MLRVSPAAQSFTKIASEKASKAKDAASKAADKSSSTGRSAYDSVAANLQSAKDASTKQLEDTRSAADQQWAKLQKVRSPVPGPCCSPHGPAPHYAHSFLCPAFAGPSRAARGLLQLSYFMMPACC